MESGRRNEVATGTSPDRRAFAALSVMSWAVTSVMLLVAAVLAISQAVPFEMGRPGLNMVVALVFAPVAFVFTHLRFEPRIAGVCDAVAVMATFALVAAVYSYGMTIAGSAIPAFDAQLYQADQALGLDWRGYLAWLDRHPAVGTVLEWCYGSVLKQTAALLTCLAVLGHMRRLQLFVLATQLSLVVCCAAPAVFPAVGVHAYLHVVPLLDHPHLPLPAIDGPIAEILRLRGAAPTIRLDTITGVVVCPSFHTVLVVLFSWGFWSVPVVRWVALAVNAGMLAATPLSGGHYFVDVLAGIVVAVAAIATARAVAGWLDRRLAGAAPSPVGSVAPVPG